MNKIKDYLSEANHIIKGIDPNEDNPTLNSLLATLNNIKEEVRIIQSKQMILLSEFKETIN